MRVFVGIKISSDLGEKIEELQKDFKSYDLRFIDKENFHITLVPPWREENNQESIKKLKTISFKSFEIVFDKIFINFKNKVIWIESTNPPEAIAKLHKKLLGLFKVKNEKREFKPHITIVRFSAKGGSSFGRKDAYLKKIHFKETVDNITLFKSILSPKGAKYEEIFSHQPTS